MDAVARGQDDKQERLLVMERISVMVFFCVALIVGIILQAPPQVYKNVSSYYERIGKRPASVQATIEAPAPVSKPRIKKAAKRQSEQMNASFAPFEEDGTSDAKTRK